MAVTPRYSGSSVSKNPAPRSAAQTQFIYKVRTRNGQVQQGVLPGRSRAAVIQRLQAQGYTVLSVEKPAGELTLWQRLNEPRGKVPAATMAMFCRQFAVMLGSGMSVLEALTIVGDLMRDLRLKRALAAVRQEVMAGTGLGAAIASQSKVFPPMVIQMVEAGETSGNLHEVMERLAAYYEQETEIKAKIKEALMYPTLVGLMAIVAINILVFFVLPQFVEIFDSMNMELPFITQLVMDSAKFVLRFWWAIMLSIASAVGLLHRWLNTPKGNIIKDRFLLAAPVLGPAVTKFVFGRFSRTLALLARSGVPIVEGLRIVERLVLNEPVAEAVARTRAAVERGASLTQAMGREKIFPRMLVQMTQVGEESGSIDTTLNHLADFYDREAGYAIKNLTTLLEPIIIVGLTVVVLFLALAVVVPMFQMSTTVPGA